MRANISRNFPGRTYRFYKGKSLYEFGCGLSSPPLSKKQPGQYVATGIQHATTFLQWHKGNCYIFQINPSLNFTQWDPRGWCLVHWRSQHAWEALYQNENSGSSFSEVEETDVEGFYQ